MGRQARNPEGVEGSWSGVGIAEPKYWWAPKCAGGGTVFVVLSRADAGALGKLGATGAGVGAIDTILGRVSTGGGAILVALRMIGAGGKATLVTFCTAGAGGGV